MDVDRTIALGVNDGIHVARVFETGDEDRQVHTYVGDIGDRLMILPIPSASGVLMYFPREARLAVYVTRDDALYRGESRVVRVFRRRRMPVMEVTVPRTYTREQRRDSVRWQCSLDVRWQAVDEEGDQGRGITINISCGGMLCGSSRTLRIGRRYRFCIQVPGGPLSIEGVVVRMESDGQAQGSLWAVRFTSIEVTDQDRIVSFIFAEQLRMRRLGLL